MKLYDLDISRISDFSKLINTQSVTIIDGGISNNLRTTLYYHYNQEKNIYSGLLVLGKQHGNCDMLYYKQQLKLYFERHCLRIQRWQETNDRLCFELSEQESIIVDGNKTLISIEAAFSHSLDTAKEIKAVSHYTEIRAAYKILSSQSFLAKSLSAYLSEADFSINENSRRLAFLVSLSRMIDSDEEMWYRFGDRHYGCKIDFYFKRSLFDAFNPLGPYCAYDEEGNTYLIAPNQSTRADCIPNVWLDLHYYIVEYSDAPQNNSAMEIVENGAHDFTIIDNIGKWVDSRFQFQDEIRLVPLLWSGERTEIPFIKKVRLPFSSDAIDHIHVTIGKCAGPSGEKVRALAKQYTWLIVDDE